MNQAKYSQLLQPTETQRFPADSENHNCKFYLHRYVHITHNQYAAYIHFKASRNIQNLIEFMESVTKHINLTFNSGMQLKLTLYFVCLYSFVNLHYNVYICFHCAYLRSRWYIRNFDDGFCGREKRLWNGAYRSCFAEFWSQTSLHTHVLPSVCMLTCDTNFANLIFTLLMYTILTEHI